MQDSAITNKDVVLTIAGAVLGAVVSYYLPALIDYLHYRKAKTILGDWHSSWSLMNDKKTTWMTERVTISAHLGKVKLINNQNSGGYEWEGIGEIVHSKHLLGKYWSLRPGATSRGIFSVTLCPQGHYMVGHFVGPNDHDMTMIGKFVLGRTPEDVKKAKKFICHIDASNYEKPVAA